MEAYGYFQKREWDKAEKLYYEIVSSTSNTLKKAFSYNNLGIIKANNFDYTKALIFYKKADSLLLLKGKENQYRAYIATNTGLIHKLNGNYKEAIQKYLLAEYIAKANNDSLTLGRIYNNMGTVYQALSEYNKSIHYYRQSYRLKKEFDRAKIHYPIFNLAILLSKHKIDFDIAHFYFKQVLRIIKPEETYLLIITRLEYALFLARNGKKDSSIDIIKEIEKVIGTKPIMNTDFFYMKLGEYYSLSGQYEKSIYFYDKAIMKIAPREEEINFQEEMIKVSPNLSLARIFKEKGGVFYSQYIGKKENVNHLFLAYENYSKAIKIINLINENSFFPEDKQLVLYTQKTAFDGMIGCCYEIYKETGDTSYVKQAFYYSELSKNNEMNKFQAFSKGGKDSIIPEKKRLMNQMNYSWSRIRENDLSGLETIRYYSVIDSIYQLVKKYPSTKKEEKLEVSIDQVQKTLSANLTFLQYHLVDTILYTFSITSDNYFLHKTPFPSFLKKNIRILLDKCSAFPRRMDSDTFYFEYVRITQQLYSHLLEPVKPYLRKRLKIIPHDVLYNVMFDGLTYPDSVANHFFDTHYLFFDYAISYDYSAKSYLNNSDTKIAKGFIGFFPTYKSGKYAQINWKESVDPYKKVFGLGDFYEKENGTKENFLLHLKKGIIHISAHGEEDSMDYKMSKLIFYYDSVPSNSSYLYNYQVPIDNFNQSLFVLSACKSGKGKLIRGSGIQSIGRNLRASGATVLLSPWSLDVYASDRIVLQFYKDIKKGVPLDISLAEAKRHYMRICETSFHYDPYFWLSLSLFGNEKEIEKDYYVYYVIAVSLLAFFCFLFFFFVYRRK